MTKLETIKEKNLPRYGVGPFYVGGVILFTIVGIILTRVTNLRTGAIKGWPLIALFMILGSILFLEGLFIYAKGFLGKNRVLKYVDAGMLYTDGVFKYVRNPGYSGIMFMCSGALFFALNIYLLVLPIVYWLAMTIMLIFSEERWLKAKYGQDYIDYKKRTNRCIPWFRKKTALRYVADVVALIASVCIFLFIAGGYIVNQYFGIRYEKDEFWDYKVEQFDGLSADKYTFQSDRGQTLTGYLYYGDSKEKNGVVVFGHGFGGTGQTNYLPYINEFAQNGYYVFGFDATGYDESEGESMLGLPQQIIDMDYAIDFVEELEETKDLPVALWGHSWGGYTVANELQLHPEVKACIINAGFNQSSDLIKSWGLDIVGPSTYALMPFIDFYEYLIMGDISKSTAVESFKKSDAKVLIYQCINDTVVPKKYGYDIWKREFAANDRFEFHLLTDHEEEGCHSQMLNSKDFIKWQESFDDESGYTEWFENLDYDYQKEPERFVREKNAFLEAHLDRKKWANRADKEMFQYEIDFLGTVLLP